MTGATTGTITVPGATLYYETRGSGPLLLMIPPGSSGADVFLSVAEHLAAHHRVVTYDRRGYARSPLDDANEEQRVEPTPTTRSVCWPHSPAKRRTCSAVVAER